MRNRNSSVGNPTTTPRRSPRLLLQHNHNSPKPKSAKKSSVQSVGLRRSPRLNNGVAGFPSLRRSPRFSNHKEPKSDEKLSKSGKLSRDSAKAKGREAKMEDNCGASDEGIAAEGGGKEGKGRNGERIEVGVKRKHGGEEITKGWTKEQELALQKAYFTAKPSPHFWKNVSKLVPGKSQQDCFDRVHHDFMTPPQAQPRSRAKTMNLSPLHQFSISASKLLKPIEKTVGRSNFLKPKSYITQKSIEKLLQRHLKVDQDREGDIFSVLEPNTDFSTNAFPPSQALCTPKQEKENKGLLQSCTERSSSSSSLKKKSLSRFSSSGVQDLVSPPVLKQVKNRVLHEKYISQLRCREARRRAASARTQMSMTGEGSSIQKRDVVKAAKVALVSEARDAINKFQQSQANFMGNTCSSDEDNEDDIGGVECESQ